MGADEQPGAGISARLAALARQSLVYGLGSVVSRFASLVLLPVYTHYLSKVEYGAVEVLVATVAVAGTVAQLGMVNALFRFALEREGDARWAVVRTALAFAMGSGTLAALLGAALTPWAAPALLGSGREALWLVSCAGLLVALLYEPAVGLYRVEQRARRYLAITIVNVAVTVVASVVGVVVFKAGALGLVAGSYAGTAFALCVVALDRRAVLYGRLDRAVLAPMLRFGLPFMPSRVALWGLNFANRLLLLALASRAAVGLFAPAVRIAQVVALLVTAFQLAWPPFAYAIREDGEARRVYRAVLTYWMLISTWLVLGLALLRGPIFDLVARGFRAGADPMAVYALGLAFYGGYYVVGVAVGRVKQTQLNWVVTGVAAAVNLALCAALIPGHGVMGAAIASTAAYAAMAGLMTLRGERVFPVGYEWRRVGLLLAVAAALFVAADLLLPRGGVVGIPARLAVVLAYPLGLLVAGFFRPEERRRLRALTAL